VGLCHAMLCLGLLLRCISGSSLAMYIKDRSPSKQQECHGCLTPRCLLSALLFTAAVHQAAGQDDAARLQADCGTRKNGPEISAYEQQQLAHCRILLHLSLLLHTSCSAGAEQRGGGGNLGGDGGFQSA
jgi:hypothetical protein